MQLRCWMVGVSLFGVGLASSAWAGPPDEYAQYMVELINRARLAPAAEVARFPALGGNLNEGPPTLGGVVYTIGSGTHGSASFQPLAVNFDIMDTAQAYSQALNNADQFTHTLNGTTAEGRMQAEGYTAAGPNVTVYGGAAAGGGSFFIPGRENLSFAAKFPTSGGFASILDQMDNAHEGLFVDQTVPSRGHRSTMMYGAWREIGVGYTIGTDVFMNNPSPGSNTWDSIYIVCNFGHQNTHPFITGVCYDDADGDDFYTPGIGEALGGVAVQARTAGTSTVIASTVSYAAGGYALQVPAGTYDVVFSGPGISRTVPNIVVGSQNRKVDGIPLADSQAPALTTVRSRKSHG